MSRIEYFNPAIYPWMLISAGWFAVQVGIMLYDKRGSWSNMANWLLIPGLFLVFSATAGRFLYARYWPATLSIFPAIMFARALRPKNFKSWPRSVKYPTIALGLVAALAYTGPRIDMQPRLTTAERLLEHGFRSATYFEMQRLKQEEPASLDVYREMLRKGRLIFESEGVGNGQVMLMGQAAARLLAAGSPERDVPLVFDAIERIQSDCERRNYAGNKTRFESMYDVASPLSSALFDYLSNRNPPVPVDPAASLRSWREGWNKSQMEKPGTAPDQDHARLK